MALIFIRAFGLALALTMSSITVAALVWTAGASGPYGAASGGYHALIEDRHERFAMAE
jgi:hypothetical protein